MPKSSYVNFKAVKAAVTMEQILEHYGLLEKFKRSGDSLSGPCPIHKGTNPTQFRVSLSKNVWNCFSECKHGGNTLDFIAEMENISIHAAAVKAVEWFKLDLEKVSSPSETVPEEETETPPRKSAAPKKPSAEESKPNPALKFRLDKLEREHPYLKERGLSLETVVDFGVGFCAKGMMAGRIAIPIHNSEGQVVAYAGRFPGQAGEDTPKYKLPPGFRKSQELFNADRAFKEPPAARLIIVEGFFDAMKLHQNGCKKVVAIMGSTLSAAQEEIIRRRTDAHSLIMILLDEDDAGRAGREDIAVRLSRFAFVKVITFAKEGQQPGDLTAGEMESLFD